MYLLYQESVQKLLAFLTAPFVTVTSQTKLTSSKGSVQKASSSVKLRDLASCRSSGNPWIFKYTGP